jgi:hypothetical protein
VIVRRGGELDVDSIPALPAFHVSAGFTTTDRSTVGDRPGQVLEIRLN